MNSLILYRLVVMMYAVGNS